MTGGDGWWRVVPSPGRHRAVTGRHLPQTPTCTHIKVLYLLTVFLCISSHPEPSIERCTVSHFSPSMQHEPQHTARPQHPPHLLVARSIDTPCESWNAFAHASPERQIACACNLLINAKYFCCFPFFHFHQRNDQGVSAAFPGSPSSELRSSKRTRSKQCREVPLTVLRKH